MKILERKEREKKRRIEVVRYVVNELQLEWRTRNKGVPFFKGTEKKKKTGDIAGCQKPLEPSCLKSDNPVIRRGIGPLQSSP